MISTQPIDARPLSRTLRGDAAGRAAFGRIVSESPEMLNLFSHARRAARTDCTVLITGESGTGKELVAEGIHLNSPRRDGPFVVVNMAAIPDSLVESELFGHGRGAFTGATADRIGRFEAAVGGTLFIDEIGDFPLESQAKLLRALENLTVTPVGTNEVRRVDVRVVAATSRDLNAMLAEGTFRVDLYYRLNVISLSLPPLRHRPGDVRLLAELFLRQFCERNDRPLLRIDPELMNFMEGFEWPGNVRQLRNCIESMTVMARGDALTMDDLPSHMLQPAGRNDGAIRIPAGTPLETIERTAILQALDHCSGNRMQAAQSLGISVRTLQRRLKSWGDEMALPAGGRRFR